MRHGTQLKPDCDELIECQESCARISHNVGVLLRRKKKSWSWLANQLGVHRSRMTELIKGEQLISVNRLANIAIVLGVAMDFLHRPIPKENSHAA